MKPCTHELATGEACGREALALRGGHPRCGYHLPGYVPPPEQLRQEQLVGPALAAAPWKPRTNINGRKERGRRLTHAERSAAARAGALKRWARQRAREDGSAHG